MTATTRTTNESQTWYEEIQTSGEQLLGKVKELIQEGNVQRMILKNEDGQTLLEIPMSAGVAATVATAVFAPVLVAVSAIAAMVSNVTLVVERRDEA